MRKRISTGSEGDLNPTGSRLPFWGLGDGWPFVGLLQAKAV
jgi:hypothetical protein